MHQGVLAGVGLPSLKAFDQLRVHPSAPGKAHVRLPIVVGVLSLRHQPVNPPTVVCGAFLLLLRDPFVLPGVDIVCWMAGPGLSPGWLALLLTLASLRMPSVSGPLKQHQVRLKVQVDVDF